MIFDDESVQINFLPSAAVLHAVNANYSIALFPRGGGKTTYVIGPRILRLNEVMPRSQILLFSDTYDRLQKRIVPNIISFLTNKAGMIEGVDFVKYKKPPDSFEKPLIPLDKFEHVISFASGMALCLVSLNVEGSANAYNAQAAIGDEVKFCNEKQINAEVIPALRGSEDLFGHLPEYLSVWMVTDKYGDTKWLLRIRDKKVNHKAVDIVKKLQEKICEYEKKIEQHTSRATISKYKKLIEAFEQKANPIRKNLVFVSDMKPEENKVILGEYYFRKQRRTCTTIEYNVAILNHDPVQVEHTFYPTLTKANKHKVMTDYDPFLPFVGAMDYNYRISPLPVIQISALPGRTLKSVNVVDYIYELFPKGIADAVKTFCNKYEGHLNKEFHYIYDHTAIGRNPMKKTFKEVFIESFENEGWTVIEHPTGDAPDHDLKFENIKAWLSNQEEYAVMINEIRCNQLILSVEQSPAIIVNGLTKKDKRTEKLDSFPAEDSTHGSDALDQLLYGLFEFDIKSQINDSYSGMDIAVA